MEMKRTKEALITLLIAVLVFGGLAGWYSAARSNKSRARIKALTATVAAASPLISAIQRYEAKVGFPPPALSALVPAYLGSMPAAGPAAKSGWRYEIDPVTKNWSLRIDVREELSPNMFLGFGDTFEFRSNGRYPREAYGGIMSPFGKWAYYVE
jgi:hypothetical protein